MKWFGHIVSMDGIRTVRTLKGKTGGERKKKVDGWCRIGLEEYKENKGKEKKRKEEEGKERNEKKMKEEKKKKKRKENKIKGKKKGKWKKGRRKEEEEKEMKEKKRKGKKKGKGKKRRIRIIIPVYSSDDKNDWHCSPHSYVSTLLAQEQLLSLPVVT